MSNCNCEKQDGFANCCKLAAKDAENARLRKALEFIASGCLVPPDGGQPSLDDAINEAREALRSRKGEV